MFYYLAIIQYDGTNYAGFQWQNGLQTIQGEFNHVLSQFISDKFSTMAASRTDTGVHAREQVVKITSQMPLDCMALQQAINLALPSKIRCLKLRPCPGDFRPSAHAISKEYRYFFINETLPSTIDRTFVANISNQLDFGAMNKSLQALCGEHDFCNFYSSGSNVKSTIRTITTCELSIVDPHQIFAEDLFRFPPTLHSCYQLKIEANGFLKQMIRHLISALWKVGSGKVSPEEFVKLIDGPKSEKQLWKVAPPNGLFLYKIHY